MRKIFILSVVLIASTTFSLVQAQEKTKKPGKPKIDLTGRSSDHLLLQVGFTQWSGVPDTINTGGFSKSLNGYFMMDYPSKSNAKFSTAIGVGIGSDRIGFQKTHVRIAELSNKFAFTNARDTNHFKKTTLVTTYVEAPVEFRYTANPTTGKGFKFAAGVKVGMMLNAHTRNTKWENRNETLINNYVSKESSKHYFNTTRVVGTLRAGLGHVSVFGTYQFASVIKDGYGPQVKPFTIGLTISGL
jgi:hypothetical protein